MELRPTSHGCMYGVTDCLLSLSPDSFDLFSALSAMKVPAKGGIACLPDIFALHVDQQRVLMHGTPLLNFLLPAKMPFYSYASMKVLRRHLGALL